MLHHFSLSFGGRLHSYAPAVLHEYVCGISGVGFYGVQGHGSTPYIFTPYNALYFGLQFIGVSVERFLEESFPSFKRAPFLLRLGLVIAWLSVTTTLFVNGRGLSLAHSRPRV